MAHLLPLGRPPLACSQGGGIGDVARGTRGSVDVAIDGRRCLEEVMRILSLGRLLRRVCLLLIRGRVMRAWRWLLGRIRVLQGREAAWAAVTSSKATWLGKGEAWMAISRLPQTRHCVPREGWSTPWMEMREGGEEGEKEGA